MDSIKKLIAVINNVFFSISIISLSLSSLFILSLGFYRLFDLEMWGHGTSVNVLAWVNLLVIQTGSLGIFLITRHYRNHFREVLKV